MSIVFTYLSGLLFNIVSGLGFHLLERWRPFRPIDYRRRLASDFGALVWVWMIFAGINAFEVSVLGSLGLVALAKWPLWIKLPVFYVAYDFGAYWVHRFMHRPRFWRMHVWHHMPQDIYWLSGCRASIFHAGLYRLAYLPFFFFVFEPVVAVAVSTEVILANSWMHLNLKWYPWMRHLEWLLVTPRFHHLHHGVQAEFHDQNYGARFTIWDRWFGTYLDPDKVDPRSLSFGVPLADQPGPVRAALGV